jgi:hypothetical protein
MRRIFLAALCCLWAVSCYAQTTAIRPDQISPGTPDITWQQGPGGYQIGTTIPWRTDSTNAPSFTTADNAKTVELTYSGAGTITAAVPAATGGSGAWPDGSGFVIQVRAGTLILNQTTPSTINGLTSIKIGPYQSVGLASRGGNWYANLSIPQPPVQTGGTVLCDNMIWAATCTATGGAPVITHVQDNFANNVTAGVATLPVTLPSTVAGHLFVVLVAGYSGSNPITATSVTATTPTTCTHVPSTFVQTTGQGFSDMWYCQGNAAGSVTFTATYTVPAGSNQVNYPSLTASEFAGANTTGALLASSGNNYVNTSGITSFTISTGVAAAANDLVVSGVTPGTANPNSMGGSQIVFTNDASASYQNVTPAGTVTHTYGFAASNTVWASIAAFTHP